MWYDPLDGRRLRSLDYELWTACGRSRSPAALPHLQKGRLPIARHMISEKIFFFPIEL